MARMIFNPESNPQTATCLAASSNSSKEDDNVKLCMWCDKSNHSSLECYKLQKLTVNQRKEIVIKKKGCTVCLKTGHNYKNCKAFVKCIICNKKLKINRKIMILRQLILQQRLLPH